MPRSAKGLDFRLFLEAYVSRVVRDSSLYFFQGVLKVFFFCSECVSVLLDGGLWILVSRTSTHPESVGPPPDPSGSVPTCPVGLVRRGVWSTRGVCGAWGRRAPLFMLSDRGEVLNVRRLPLPRSGKVTVPGGRRSPRGSVVRSVDLDGTQDTVTCLRERSSCVGE